MRISPHLLRDSGDDTFTLRDVGMPLPPGTSTFSMEMGVATPHSQEIWYTILYTIIYYAMIYQTILHYTILYYDMLCYAISR